MSYCEIWTKRKLHSGYRNSSEEEMANSGWTKGNSENFKDDVMIRGL